MEFNEQFYHRLFKLTASSKKESSLNEIRKIVQDVTAYYAANGMTELWQNLPGEDSSSSDVAKRNEKDKSMPPLKKDSLLSHDVSSGPQHLKPSPGRFSASPHVHKPVTEKRNSNELLDSFSSSVGDCSLDSESIQFVQNVKTEKDAESSWPVNSSGRSEDDSILSVQLPTVGIKRSFSNEETSQTESLNELPQAKLPRIDDHSRTSGEKPNIKSESSSIEDSFGGLCCVVCNQFSNPSGNRIVVCHECHNFYHQKCHEPNIPQSQIDDPRLLWYCNVCSKKLKKSSFTPKISNQSSSSKLQSKDLNKDRIKSANDSNLKRIVDVKDKIQSSIQSSVQDKMLEFAAKHKIKTAAQVKPNLSTSTPSNLNQTNSSTVSSGLAGLGKLATTHQKSPLPNVSGLGKLQQIAASSVNSNLKLPSSSSASSSAATTSTAHKAANFSSAPMVQAAEKRLQQMKKKAASKSSFIK